MAGRIWGFELFREIIVHDCGLLEESKETPCREYAQYGYGKFRRSRTKFMNEERNMTNYICATCGVQYTETDSSPEHCIICEDERQYIKHKGQRWTTLPEMQKSYHNRIEDVDPNVTGIGTVPGFAIGQRALLIQTPQGNVLWDCVSLLDDATLEAIRSRGGIAAIAVSHPHLVG